MTTGRERVQVVLQRPEVTGWSWEIILAGFLVVAMAIRTLRDGDERRQGDLAA